MPSFIKPSLATNLNTLGLPYNSIGKINAPGSILTLGATPGITYTPPGPTEQELGNEPSLNDIYSVIRNENAISQAASRIAASDPLMERLKKISNPQADFDINAISPLDQEPFTYTGSDLRVFIDIAGTNGKQLLELTTITVSVHREKAPVRACGYINPKGFARGRRTIAGTMILTQFYADVLYRFLDRKWNQDISKDNPYKKPDQLPPFNLTFYFADEYGHASYRRLLGVDSVTDGTVYSVQDQMTEQTISFMASDFTPLLPIDTSPMTLGYNSKAAKAEKTPRDARLEYLVEQLPPRKLEIVDSSISFEDIVVPEA